MVDMTKYAGAAFIKVDDVAEASLRKTVKSVEEGKYGKPVLTFTDGSKLSLNATNTRAMIKAFGKDDADWIAQKIELYGGTIPYNGTDDNPAVLVRSISPATAQSKQKSEPTHTGADDMDEEIPF